MFLSLPPHPLHPRESLGDSKRLSLPAGPLKHGFEWNTIIASFDIKLDLELLSYSSCVIFYGTKEAGIFLSSTQSVCRLEQMQAVLIIISIY